MRSCVRRAVLAAWLMLGAACAPGFAQSSATKAAENGASEPATKSEGQAEGASPVWAWANFALLAGALGYLAVKKGGPWFVSRSLAIRKGIAEAEEIRRDAESRYAAVERNLAHLQADLEALRAEARGERDAEGQRLRTQTELDLARIQEHNLREIEAAGKKARVELKRYAARLAVDLAEQKIRRQMTPEIEAALVDKFVRDLDQPSSNSHPKK